MKGYEFTQDKKLVCETCKHTIDHLVYKEPCNCECHYLDE